MAINYFIYSILLISSFSVFIDVNQEENSSKKKEQAQVIFNNSTLYTMNTQNIDRIINSSQIKRFENRDIMYDAKIILRTKNNLTDYIQSDIIVKRDDLYKFLNNVRYNKGDNLLLNTNELFYDNLTKIATNSSPFKAVYNGNILNGENLHLDSNNLIFKAKNSHFEVGTDINKGK